jgi:hypothetical protein
MALGRGECVGHGARASFRLARKAALVHGDFDWPVARLSAGLQSAQHPTALNAKKNARRPHGLLRAPLNVNISHYASAVVGA